MVGDGGGGDCLRNVVGYRGRAAGGGLAGEELSGIGREGGEGEEEDAGGGLVMRTTRGGLREDGKSGCLPGRRKDEVEMHCGGEFLRAIRRSPGQLFFEFVDLFASAMIRAEGVEHGELYPFTRLACSTCS